MEIRFLENALFAGMTANAYRLGMTLTLGWFWVRLAGCSILYRGSSMSQTDFENILAVAEADAAQISAPSYLVHDNSTTYFYVIRRANECGDEECTLSAAVKVAIDANGDLAEPRPNDIFELVAGQEQSDKVQLTWYYSPINQESTPVSFMVYGDAGTGQIDFVNSIAEISYAGRRFYNYLSDSLNPGQYLFCVKAKDAAGEEGVCSIPVKIQVNTASPEAVDILSVEAT